MAKNTAGTITDYQTNVITKFRIQKENNSENFEVKEKFNFQKMTDKYEEKIMNKTLREILQINITETYS